MAKALTTRWHERFPTPFRVKRVSDSILGSELSFYFVSGFLTQEQYEQLANVIPVLAAHKVDDRVIVSTLISQEKCEQLIKVFEPLSTGKTKWSGQYYVLANEIVRECSEALKEPNKDV